MINGKMKYIYPLLWVAAIGLYVGVLTTKGVVQKYFLLGEVGIGIFTLILLAVSINKR